MGRQRGRLGRFHIIHEEEKAYRQGRMDLHGPFRQRVRQIAKDQSAKNVDQFSAIARQDNGAENVIVTREVGNLRSINQSLGGCASYIYACATQVASPDRSDLPTVRANARASGEPTCPEPTTMVSNSIARPPLHRIVVLECQREWNRREFASERSTNFRRRPTRHRSTVLASEIRFAARSRLIRSENICGWFRSRWFHRAECGS